MTFSLLKQEVNYFFWCFQNSFNPKQCGFELHFWCPINSHLDKLIDIGSKKSRLNIKIVKCFPCLFDLSTKIQSSSIGY